MRDKYTDMVAVMHLFLCPVGVTSYYMSVSNTASLCKTHCFVGSGSWDQEKSKTVGSKPQKKIPDGEILRLLVQGSLAQRFSHLLDERSI